MDREISRRGLMSAFAAFVMPALAKDQSIAPDANGFAQAYNEWAEIANARAKKPGTLDAREPLAWKRVKEEFKRLERLIDPIYKG